MNLVIAAVFTAGFTVAGILQFSVFRTWLRRKLEESYWDGWADGTAERLKREKK